MLRLLCLLPVLLLGSLAALAQIPFEPDQGLNYGLICRGSGRSLDVAMAATRSNAPAVQWEFTHAPSQQWHLVPLRAGSEYYRIEAKHSGQCLTVERSGENAPLVQRPFAGSTDQQWKLVPAGPIGSFYLENRAEGLVAAISTADKFNGTTVVAQRPQGRASQQWRLFKLRLNLDQGAQAFGLVQPMGVQINSPGNEYQPVLAPDGSALYFARTKFAGNTEGNTDSGDAWRCLSTDRGLTWGPPQRLDALNTTQNNAVLAVVGGVPVKGKTSPPRLLVRGTYDSNSTFRDEGCSLAFPPVTTADGSQRTTRPVPVRIANYYSASPATGFFLTPDEQVLLLSLERGDSQGANDLYVSRPDGSGGYTEPLSLGATLNSPGFEFAPWLAPDGKTLYFSSYGHLGYGSADVFVSERLDESWTSWSEPRNLGAPINGPGFDAYFILSPDGREAYYASSRAANGAADLWRSGRVARLPADSTLANETLARALFTGRVLDAKTRQVVPGATVQATLISATTDFRATATTDRNTGGFLLSALAGRYRVQASAGGGFLTTVDTLRLAGSVSRDLLLRPAVVGDRLDLPSIIFAQSKATLLDESYAELNRLAATMQANPQLEIRLEGHTDNVGPPEKNQQLSEERVTEVKRYLVGRGVAASRIGTVGFGGSKPRYGNDREETRKLNRRVELVITKQ